MEYAKRYFEEVKTIAKSIDIEVIEKMVQIICDLKEKETVVPLVWRSLSINCFRVVWFN